MRKGAGTVYRIEVCGEKSRKYAPTFEAMEIETEGGRTVLTGEVVDCPTFTASSTRKEDRNEGAFESRKRAS